MESDSRADNVTLDSDDENDEDDAISSATKTGEGSEPPLKKAKQMKKIKGKERRRMEKKLDDSEDLIGSLQNVSSSFGKIFGDMNSTLATMASAWTKVEEREQLRDDKSDKVLEEVLKLEGFSPSEALAAATLLIGDKSKLSVFYQAPSSLKKQYICDLLKNS